jgi:hypothetical protein
MDRGDAGQRRRRRLEVDGTQAHPRLHARGQPFEQRLVRELGGSGFGGRASEETRQRRRQHVQAARADHDVCAGAQRQIATLGLRAGHFDQRFPCGAT